MSDAKATSAVQLSQIAATSTEAPSPESPTEAMQPTETTAPKSAYGSPLGRILTGVKIYFGQGEEKTLAFEILGGSDKCPSIADGKGVYVQYPDGKNDWKSRDALINSGTFFIRLDDPAISNFGWKEYGGCP